MAFVSTTQYKDDMYRGKFVLQDHGHTADVIFLYRSVQDFLVGNVHYVKSDSYSGYVHCSGRGCVCCARGLRKQTKIFIPVLNLSTNQVEFWERNMKFEPQFMRDVFANYPNPSEYVFRITRNGASGDVNTRYLIQATHRNTEMPYDKIMQDFGISFPNHYDTICKEFSDSELSMMIPVRTGDSQSSGGGYGYTATPRGGGSGSYNSSYSTMSHTVSPNVPMQPVVIPSDFDPIGEDDAPF